MNSVFFSLNKERRSSPKSDYIEIGDKRMRNVKIQSKSVSYFAVDQGNVIGLPFGLLEVCGYEYKARLFSIVLLFPAIFSYMSTSAEQEER